jgi:phosphoribosylformylglycinamidine synthase subunit PurQ / glutaminase
MNVGVVTFPGSNCDDDLLYVLQKIMGFKTTPLWHKDAPDLSDFHLIAIPGGFSYGDYLRCGSMASLSPIMQKVKEFAGKGGLVLGVCNGFQILCEAGLLPGALARNESLLFQCRDVAMKVETANTPWTLGVAAGEKVSFPIAHGEGRYVVDDKEFEEMKKNGQIILTYLNDNPNGSMHNIAGVTNAGKNVFGLMPHPERATDLRSKDGMKLWKSIKQYLEEKAS